DLPTFSFGLFFYLLGNDLGTVDYTYSKEFWENQDGDDPVIFWISRIAAL
ncbi:unnamed protein product, partial [marine sediment metagenome]